ncbi:MAG: DUF4838 domain-containing protein, partial [Treponema sp.]|nr:DUF4838 domain-containing protein [Treponema sp.]
DRIEVYGGSEQGLCLGIYDFLAALGFSWPGPGREDAPRPSPADSPRYPLSRPWANGPLAKDPVELKRLVLPTGKPPGNWEALLAWAIRNRFDALVLPLGFGNGPLAAFRGNERRVLEKLPRLCSDYGLTLEVGGWDLSLLVPRRYFMWNKELFRMEAGRRVRDHQFCPTNPGAIRLIQEEAARYFRARPGVGIFHLWPDHGAEGAWCSCPTCRAFSREEQNRIAVNAAADVLAGIRPGARLSYYEDSDIPSGINPRPNMFRLNQLTSCVTTLNR